MNVACNADGLIKMVKSGILEVFAQQVNLLVGPQVYREAVEEGKDRGYPDAFELERILKEHARIRRSIPRISALVEQFVQGSMLGAGEREALRLYFREEAEAVLSDDRGFLRALETQGIPYLTPAAAVIFMVEQDILPLAKAQKALEKLRPLIRRDQYEAALQDLRGFEERGG